MRVFAAHESAFRDLYYGGYQTRFSSPCEENDAVKWPCYEQLRQTTWSPEGFSATGIHTYFRELIDSHPDWNVFMVRHPRFSPAILHTLEHMKAICVYSGKCTLYIDKQSYSLNEGDVCFLQPGVTHTVGVFSDESVVFNLFLRSSVIEDCFISFLKRDDILSKFFSSMHYDPHFTPVMVFRTYGDEVIRATLSKLENEMYEIRDRYTAQMAEVRALELFGLLMRRHSDDVTIIDRKTKSRDNNVVACLRYLDEHYAHVTLYELTERFHYSQSQLSKIIRQHTGKTFLDFVRGKKLERAAALLKTTDMPIKDVSEMAGFSNPSHFYRCFSSVYGMTPLEYRVRQAN